MSSLRGEQALKDGVSFEFTWTARHLIEVMEERAEAIIPGGLAGESGVDFRLYYADHEEHHQVKRGFGSEGQWTLAALDSEGVLQDFKHRLENPQVHCYMISAIPAVQLGNLAERARSSPDFVTFESAYLNSKDYVAWFNTLVGRWNLSRDECWSRLRRVYTHAFSEQNTTAQGHTMLRPMVATGVEDAWTHLRDFCFSHVSQRVTASEIWQWLAKEKVIRRTFDNDPRVLARIAAQTKKYLDGVRRKLIKPPLERQLATTVVNSLAQCTYGEDRVILGSPGGGKSAVILQIAGAALAKGWPVLAFRLDDLPATITPKQLEEALDLPSSPAACMARASAGKPALVIIDQLDAVSLYSGRTGTLFDIVAALVEDLRAYRLRSPIHLVIACREVDWREDGRFRSLHHSVPDNSEEGIHKVENLTDEEINKILASTGFNAAMFSPRQREHLLRRPQYLALLIETKPDTGSLKGIVTPKHLFDAYWTKKQRELASALSIQGTNPWFEVLKHITDKLAETALALTPPDAICGEDEAPLAVTRASLDRFPPSVIDWMLTNGVLVEGNNRVRFGHESFFDYCFARFFSERGQSLLAYLLQSEQTLIQRGQLRQVLAYLRDEDMGAYLKTVHKLLVCDEIRPHLKYLVVTMFCGVPDPKDSEWDFIEPQIKQALRDIDSGVTASIANQFFIGFHGSMPLFKMACVRGAFAQWLQSNGQPALGRLFRVISAHQAGTQKETWELIKPLADNHLCRDQLDDLSHFIQASESRETFEWLLKEMPRFYEQDGRYPRQGERFYSLTEDLAKNKPAWLAEWLASAIRLRATRPEEFRNELLDAENISNEKILKAAEQAPNEFIEHVLPAVKYAIQNLPYYFGPWSYSSESDDSMRYVSTDEMLFDSLELALCKMLRDKHPQALIILNDLRNSDTDALLRLYAAVLCHDDDACATLVAEYLAAGGDAFSVRFKNQRAACRLLKNHSSRLSAEQLFAIEATVLNSQPKYELKKQESYGSNSPTECIGNWRGYQQMELLRSFSVERLSSTGARRLAEWERKFDSLRVLYGPTKEEKAFNEKAFENWKPNRFLHAIKARLKRTPKSLHPWSSCNGNIGSVLRKAASQRPSEFIQFLGQCDADTPKAFLDEIDSGFMNLELDSELALDAAKSFKRLGCEWAGRSVSMLGKIKPGNYVREAFKLAFDFAINGKGVQEERQPAEEGKRGERLRSMALNCVRGQAIGALRQMLWAEPALLDDLRAHLPEMMSDTCPAIRTELASLCYAVAFREENRAFATELFLRLVTQELPDEHVLTSYWPFHFIRTGLKEDWDMFKPLLIQMSKSMSSEVRSTAARLICIAVTAGIDAIEMATVCVASSDPKVRIACADVLAHNLESEHGKPWTTGALLTLADDMDKDVCRTVGFSFKRTKKYRFDALSDFLLRYAKTRAFVRNAGRLVDAIVESGSLLPSTVFDIIETIIGRLNEPVEDGSDRLSWHIEMVVPVLTRLYHENRDGALRKRALNLIDLFCLNGVLSHASLDK